MEKKYLIESLFCCSSLVGSRVMRHQKKYSLTKFVPIGQSASFDVRVLGHLKISGVTMFLRGLKLVHQGSSSYGAKNRGLQLTCHTSKVVLIWLLTVSSGARIVVRHYVIDSYWSLYGSTLNRWDFCKLDTDGLSKDLDKTKIFLHIFFNTSGKIHTRVHTTYFLWKKYLCMWYIKSEFSKLSWQTPNVLC